MGHGATESSDMILMRSAIEGPDDDDTSSGFIAERADREIAFGVVEKLAREGPTHEVGSTARELRRLFQHEFFCCASIRAYDGRILRVVNVDFPNELLDGIELRAGSVDCSPLRQWLSARVPVIVRDVARLLPAALREPLASHTARHALALHGQLDSTGTRGLVFCFGKIPAVAIASCERALQVVTPYLYSAMARSFWSPPRSVNVRPLTAREIEVIEWMFYGKTNEEIAELLDISVYTVKNHVQKILLKLSASNRTQAVLRAEEAGIVRYQDSATRRAQAERQSEK